MKKIIVILFTSRLSLVRVIIFDVDFYNLILISILRKEKKSIEKVKSRTFRTARFTERSRDNMHICALCIWIDTSLSIIIPKPWFSHTRDLSLFAFSSSIRWNGRQSYWLLLSSRCGNDDDDDDDGDDDDAISTRLYRVPSRNAIRAAVSDTEAPQKRLPTQLRAE